MAQPVSLWRDERGFLHESEAAANNADEAFERADRREVVRAMIVDRIRVSRGEEGWPFHASGDLADWLITNWPTIKAIGYAFRVDELSPGAQSVGQRPICSALEREAERLRERMGLFVPDRDAAVADSSRHAEA